MYGSVSYPDTYFGDSRVINSWKDLAEGPLDFLVFWGGEDVTPAMYGQERIYAYAPDTHRDHREASIFREAKERGIPMLGICRGSQFLCVMSGGELYQDIGREHCNGHQHKVWTQDGKTFDVTSTHHQMMSPQKVNHKVIAYAKEAHIFKKEGLVEAPQFDYEIVWFPDTKCLGVQGHPEYLTRHSEFSQYTFNLIKEYLDGNYKAPTTGQLYVPGGTPV